MVSIRIQVKYYGKLNWTTSPVHRMNDLIIRMIPDLLRQRWQRMDSGCSWFSERGMWHAWILKETGYGKKILGFWKIITDILHHWSHTGIYCWYSMIKAPAVIWLPWKQIPVIRFTINYVISKYHGLPLLLLIPEIGMKSFLIPLYVVTCCQIEVFVEIYIKIPLSSRCAATQRIGHPPY